MNSNESLDESNTIADENEISPEVLLKPRPEYVRRDNTIASTPSRDLDYCIKVILKEAVKENKLVKQVCYTMLSAYTSNPINLAINAPSGEGKTHVLMKVSDLFPEKDVQFIADMSNKAIFHKSGFLGVKNEDGIFVNVENELIELKESLEMKKLDLKNTDKVNSSFINETKKEIEKIQGQINEIQENAVKVIDLNHKILIFLDTPKKEIFEALMSLLSHDKYEVEYHYVDTSTRTGIITRTNVLVGWPAVIFAQAIDYTIHPRYHEIQRRFIVMNPRMDEEKYQSAVDLIIKKNCVPDLPYQLMVVSDEEKDKAREILINIRDDLLSVSSSIKPGKNNILIPYRHLIRQLLSKNSTAQDMTFVNRLLNLVGLLTNINIKKRPFLEIQPIFGSDSFRIPMALYSDLFESLSLINNSTGGIRPYVLDWYQNVFLSLYGQKSNPNSREKKGEIVTEERVAVTTQELIEKTYEVMKKHSASKNLLTEFLYPLLNLGYIDSIRSLIDGRAYIYFPVLDVTNEKSINLFLLDKKNNLFQSIKNKNSNLTSNTNRTQIISNISEVIRYYSEKKYSAMLRNADEDTTADLIEENEYKDVEEIFEKYYSDFNTENNGDQNNITAKDHDTAAPTSTPGEYLQKAENSNDLQNIQINDIKNPHDALEISNKLFHNEKKNKLINYCYRCEFETDIPTEYEKHCVLIHPNKPAYPSLVDIEKDRLKPQGKPWE